jgi:hypothetical protein
MVRQEGICPLGNILRRKAMPSLKLERTKKGFPALWEEGGASTNLGQSVVVCGQNAEPLRAVFVRSGGSLANSQHALFVVKIGCYIVRTIRTRDEAETTISRINTITACVKDSQDAFVAEVSVVYTFDRGEWDNDPPPMFGSAIAAALSKARCYHCRESHFSQKESA